MTMMVNENENSSNGNPAEAHVLHEKSSPNSLDLADVNS